MIQDGDMITAYYQLVARHITRTPVLAGEFSPSYARPSADGWPLPWVNCPLEVSQLGQLSLSSSRDWQMSSKLQSLYWWRTVKWNSTMLYRQHLSKDHKLHMKMTRSIRTRNAVSPQKMNMWSNSSNLVIEKTLRKQCQLWLVVWHSRKNVSHGWRTFHVACSTFS